LVIARSQRGKSCGTNRWRHFAVPKLAGLGGNQIKGGLTDPDDVPEVPVAPVTQPGDLWLLGDHRVLCGDSTAADAVSRLCGGERADLVFTDPPYNVDYEGYTEEKLEIQSDRMTRDAFKTKCLIS
jgi:hypothetical protein